MQSAALLSYWRTGKAAEIDGLALITLGHNVRAVLNHPKKQQVLCLRDRGVAREDCRGT
jgi:hypothetical protein